MPALHLAALGGPRAAGPRFLGSDATMNPRFLRSAGVINLLDAGPYDAFVAFEPEHVFLLTGFQMPLHRNTNPQAPAVAVVSRSAMVLMVPRIQLAYLAQHEPQQLAFDVLVTFGAFDLERPERASAASFERLQTLMQAETRAAEWESAFNAALETVGVPSRRVLYDRWPPQSAPPGAAGDLLRSKHKLEPSVDAKAVQQATRSKNELAVIGMTRSVRVTEASIIEMLRQVRVGATEIALHRAYRSAVAARGGTAVHVGIGAGENAVFPINKPSDRPLVPGDLVKVDVGALVDGFFADTACVVSVGSPTARAREIMAAIDEAQAAGLRTVAPGGSVAQTFWACLERARKTIPGYRRPHCGHGIGVSRYELPLVAPASDDVFVEGEVLNLEVPYYEFGIGGFNVEDTIIVSSDGPVKLTSLPNALLPVEEYQELVDRQWNTLP